MARKRLEDELDAARAADPSTPEGRAALQTALGSRHAPVVARAAIRVREHAVEGLFDALLAAWARLLGGVEDPGCSAKLAIAEALDEAGHLDPDPFWQGARYRQTEPSWPKPIETAGNVRSRCAAALLRLREPEVLDLLVDHLVDDDVGVRVRACELLADHGGPGAAAVLRLQIRRGDAEEEVTEAALGALLDAAPESGLSLGGELLGSSSTRLRQLAGLALGASRRPEAVPLLLRWLDAAPARPERQAALISLGLLRHPDARARLLDVVATGSGPDAHAALEALAIQRGDAEVEAQVRAAAARNRHELAAGLAKWFGER